MKVKVERTVDVQDFQDFLNIFDLESEAIAGEHGTDEELISEMLDDAPGDWLITFVDNGNGFFRLFLLSEDVDDPNEEIIKNWVGIVIEKKGVNVLVGISHNGVMNSLEWLDRDDPNKEWTDGHIYGRTVKGSERVFDDNDKLIFGL